MKAAEAEQALYGDDLVAKLRELSKVALSILAIHLLGDVPSPFLIGALSDASSLGQAVKIVPIAVVVGGCIWIWAARAQQRAGDSG